MPGVPAPEVIAVVTLRAGQPHRDRVLDAVAAQTRSPDTIVLVDLTEAPRPRRRRAPAPAIEPSGDGGLALLDAVGDEHTESHVLRLPPRTGAGDAVRAALIALQSTGLTPEAPPEGLPAPDPAAGPGPAEGPGTPADEAPGPAGTSWLWLVPDDAVPAPDTLRRLLEAVETAPSVGVAGCKQVWWEDDQRLIDVGFTTSRRGVRVTGIERYEVDQGQHDHRCDVLAVSGAGMLVRRDVWDVTGGPDPGLARARDDLDLCRRARLAGHRVVVVPRAVVSRAGRVTAAGGAPVPASRTTTRGPWARADRYDTLFLRLAGVPLPFLPLILLDILPGTLLRSLGLLLTRRPGRAVQEIIAAILVLARPHRWIPARRRAARRTLPRRMLRPLLATRRDLWRQRREALTFGSRGLPAPASSRRAVPFPGAPVRTPAPPPGPAPAPGPENDLDTGPGTVPTAATGTGIDLLIDLTGEIPVAGDRVGRRSRRDGIPAPGAGPDDEPLQIRAAGPRLTSQSRRSVVLAPLPVLLLTAVAGLLALRRLLPGTGTVAGPYLLPAPGSAAELWRAVSSPLRPLGLGARAVADPFAELVAAIGAVPGLSPRLVTAGLLIAALPLSALTAWIAVSATTRTRALRMWAALAWAASPPLLLATGSGRPSGVLAHVLLPLTALALARTVGAGRGGRHGHPADERPRGSLAAASAAGISLTAVLAAAPSLTIAAALAVLLLALAAPGRRLLLLIPVTVVGVLLAPWWWAVAEHPRLLLADPGAGTSAVPAASSAWWHLLLLPRTPTDLFGAVGRDLGALGGDLLTPTAAAVTLVALAAGPPLILGLVGVLRRGTAGRALALGWTVGLAGLGTALAAERVPVGAGTDGTLYGVPGPGLSLLTLGALLAAVVGLPGSGEATRRRGHEGIDRGAAVAVVAALTAALAVLGAWSWQGMHAPEEATAVAGSLPATVDGTPAVRLVRPDVLPAVAAAEAEGPARTRTLILDVTATRVRWNLLQAAGPRLGDDSAALAAARLDTPVTDADAGLVVPLVGDLLSDSGQDLRGRFADLGIGSVLLLPPVDDASALALDSSPGLERVLNARGATLWRVSLDGTGGSPTRPSLVRILDVDGTALIALPSDGRQVRARAPAGPEGRLLTLATRRDTGWTATVDGRRLPARTHAGWAQAFTLPAAGGTVVVTYRDPFVERLAPVRQVVAGIALLLAFPLPRLRRRAPGPPPRASRPVPRGPGPEDGLPRPAPPRIFDEDYPDPDSVIGPPIPARAPEPGGSPVVAPWSGPGPGPGPGPVLPAGAGSGHGAGPERDQDGDQDRDRGLDQGSDLGVERGVDVSAVPGDRASEDRVPEGDLPDSRAPEGTGPDRSAVIVLPEDETWSGDTDVFDVSDPEEPYRPAPRSGRRTPPAADALGGPFVEIDWGAVHLPEEDPAPEPDQAEDPATRDDTAGAIVPGDAIPGDAADVARTVPDDAGPDDPGPGDAEPEDAGLRDPGPGDAEPEDAGLRDAGPEDVGPGDAGPDDAGLRDAEPEDAEPDDAGLRDAGPEDVGPGDAGPEDVAAADPDPRAGPDPLAASGTGPDPLVGPDPVDVPGTDPAAGSDVTGPAGRATGTEENAEDEEPVPTFPLADPVELEEFEPYRPAPSRAFYRPGRRS